MPKIFDERLRALTETNVASARWWPSVYSIAAFAQVLMGTLMSRFDNEAPDDRRRAGADSAALRRGEGSTAGRCWWSRC